MNPSSAEAAFLAESLADLEKALHHLQYSAATCGSSAGFDAIPPEEQLIRVEAFTGRFARVVDILSKRVLRAIDQYEMNDPGTLLDIANRAEKRGLIDSANWLREVREVRNQISHDYAGERLQDVMAYCQDQLANLTEACRRSINHAKNLIHPSAPQTR